MNGLTPPYTGVQRKKRAHTELADSYGDSHRMGSKYRALQSANEGNGSAESRSIASYCVQISESNKLARQTSQFSPGAIMQLRLVNFQVAADCSYQFEPYLNLILGVNGSGKSTIINAIFLLFRGNLSYLDRRNYGEFVQHGKGFSVVSAQIQGRDPDSDNPIVTMKISMESPRLAVWFINGRPATCKEIDALVSEYHIQVDNLCQYLSQFRVAKFSGESAEERLKSTELAVGYDGMLDDHEYLSETGKQLNSLQNQLESRRKLIQSLTKKREELSIKEKQLQTAVSTKRQIKFLEKVDVLKSYESLKTEIREAEAKLMDAQLQLRKVEEESHINQLFVEHGKREINRITDQLNTENQVTVERRVYMHEIRQYSDTQKRLESVLKRQEVIRLAVTKRQSTLESIEGSLSDAKMESQQLRKTLNETCLPTEQFQSLQLRYNTLTENLVHSEAKYRTIKHSVDSMKREYTMKEDALKKHEDDLKQLISQVNRDRTLMDIPGKYRNDLEKSVYFVRDNQDKFEKPIILPAILSLNIVDEKMLGIVSETTNEANLLKFVCQTRNDQQLLTKLVSESRGVHLQAAFVKPNFNESGFSRQTMEKLKAVGIEGVVSDCFDAPPAMLKYLASLGYNKILYSHHPLSDDAVNLIKTISGNGGLRCIDSNQMYSIRSSRYGKKLRTEYNTVVNLRTTLFVRSMLKKNTKLQQLQLKERMDVITKHIDRLKEEIQKKESTLGQATENVTKLRLEVTELKCQVRKEVHHRKLLEESVKEETKLAKAKAEIEKQLEYDKIQALNLQLEQQSLVDLLVKIVDSPRNRLVSLMSSILKQVVISKVPQDWKNAVEIMERGLATLRESPLRLVDQCQSRLQALNQRINSERQPANQVEKSLRNSSRWGEAKQLIATKSLEEIKLELIRLRSLVVLQEQSTMSLEQVQAQLKTTMESLAVEEELQSTEQQQLTNLQDRSTEVRERWITAVNELVASTSAKFSELFARMKKSGSVSLNRPDDLAVGTWGIDINVAFRESEALSKLSAMRHSGGERAVTTAVYLLSLQRMAKAPFRVLDEINQGMDEKNERITMEFFVEMACQMESPNQAAQQYFLVTPKLIRKFPNHENMNVTLITSSKTIFNENGAGIKK